MTPPRRAVATAFTALVVAVALSSCADESAPTATPTSPTHALATTAATTIGASATRAVSGDGFALELPTTWAAYELSGDGVVQPIHGAVALPADVGGMAIASALQGGNLFGVAPPDGLGRSATIMVTLLGADDEPPAGDVSDTLRTRLAGEGISELTVETTDLDGRPAARATFRQIGETGIEQEAVTVYVPGAGPSYLLSLSRPLPAQDGSATVTDAIVESFRLT